MRCRKGLVSCHDRSITDKRLGCDEAIVHLWDLLEQIELLELRSAKIRQLYPAHGCKCIQQVGRDERLPNLHREKIELGNGNGGNYDCGVPRLG